jgi:Flp pilus assembly protein TadD
VGLANVLYAQGEVDRAAAHLSAWLKRHPASPVALNNLAMLRLEQGRVSEAGKLAEEALKQAPKALEEAVRDTLMRVRGAQQSPAP